MRKLYFLGLSLFLFTQSTFATSDPETANTSYEVSFIESGRTPDHTVQARLRAQNFWQNFIAEHGTWYVHFNEETALPTRAYGKPIQVGGSSSTEAAELFIQQYLSDFNLPIDELVVSSSPETKKFNYVNYKQVHDGMEVLGSRLVIKLTENNEVIMFGTEVYPEIELDTESFLDAQSASASAFSGLQLLITNIDAPNEVSILPVPKAGITVYRPVYTIHVNGMEGSIPVKLLCLVDAVTGELLYRTNLVKHSHGTTEHEPTKTAAVNPPLPVSGTISAELQPLHPYSPMEVRPLPNLELSINGSTLYTDEFGFFQSTANGPTTVTGSLEGLWARIFTNGITPNFSYGLNEGPDNDLSLDNDANTKELSTYYSVNQIHDHMKEVIPDFDGMDFQLPSNIDLDGDCNAFYDGNSINFYEFGNGCNATSLIADVVYHEYGHGINDKFYQDNSSFFSNGAMNEGYADFWALSLIESPLLGVGFYVDNEDPLRRYDEEPKVYPQDIVNEVHGDGEIICGAWYTTHELMGGDWDLTMDLFAEAFYGLQANTFNGNEGVAFTNVLIDVLQADDDDNDITNGTPNGNAIVEGFDTHGITLISNASLSHEDEQFAAAQTEIELELELDLNFPFTQYLDSPKLFWRTDMNSEWAEIEMDEAGGDQYVASIPAQEAGTVIAYHVGATDINNTISNVLPIGARDTDPNIPFFILVGFDLEAVHNNDTNEDFGVWATSVFDDNATTGEWEQEFPIGSFNDDGTEVAPSTEHTGGDIGELCFLTGQSSAPDAPIGENDVDGGKTTLQTPEMDLTIYEDPAITYWRWYTNSPPTGANPGADYWEVKISDDGGSSWTHVEATTTSDASWRRFAFKLSDYVELTDQVMMQFIASDSLRPGTYLDGGSLVEAALDDFFLYDLASANSVSENFLEGDFQIWPNPSNSVINLQWELIKSAKVTLKISDLTGKTIYIREVGVQPEGVHRQTIEVDQLAKGSYLIELRTEGSITTKQLFVD